MKQNNTIIETPFGIFGGVAATGYFSDGKVKELLLSEKNMVVTHVGELVPYYGEDTVRRKYKSSVTFYHSGTIKSVSLEKQQEIVTPIGEFPAELVTFYETGELKRFFPLDGKISGMWSEEDERALNIPFTFEFPFTSFTAMLVGICFYKSGDIRSLTLFPNESITVTTGQYGTFSVKNGFSLYESGLLQSVEPAVPTPITTPIGQIYAYDVNSVGIHADSNSVLLNEEGKLLGVTTSSDKIAVTLPGGRMRFFTPTEKINPMDENDITLIPLKICFDYQNQTVTITEETPNVFSLSDCTFHVYPGTLSGCTPADCANCSLCQR